MSYITRQVEPALAAALKRGKSILLLGARQTGKTTLIDGLPADLRISFIAPEVRQQYERSPSQLKQVLGAINTKNNIPPLVVLDEVQKVPEMLDVAQELIDKKQAQFILTGSSARKLKHRKDINLLPGRVVALHLDPLMLSEIPANKMQLDNLLLFGSLPEILMLSNRTDKEQDLSSYVTTYLEEEIRTEAVVRNLARFSRFLILAASESGYLVSFRRLSQDIGVSHTTISEYYQILEDCLVAERVDPLTVTKQRRRLNKSSKYLFFDLGLRRLAAKEGWQLPTKQMGHLFEQFIGLELIRAARLEFEPTKVYFWQDLNGPEVDWVIEKNKRFIPIEVKWTDKPSIKDAKHLKLFLREYDNTNHAYVVCRIPQKIKLADNITALPWQELAEIFL